jgi:hypothetical protein
VTRRPRILLFALLASAAAAIFLAIATDQSVYAPGSHHVRKEISQNAGVRRAEEKLPRFAQRWLTPAIVLRKLYSVVAFAIVGFFVAPLLRARVRLRDDAASVAGFSTLIEIVQTIQGSNEGYASNAFDILCGALGGLLGALFWNAVMRRFSRDREAR